MVDYMGACLKFCIISTLLPAYTAVCAIPKEKVNCGGIKNSTASKIFEEKRNKTAQDFFRDFPLCWEKNNLSGFLLHKMVPTVNYLRD